MAHGSNKGVARTAIALGIRLLDAAFQVEHIVRHGRTAEPEPEQVDGVTLTECPVCGVFTSDSGHFYKHLSGVESPESEE